MSIGVVSPIVAWAQTKVGMHAGLEQGLTKILTLPIWYRVLAVVTGGTVEEVLYRGYLIERLSTLTGVRWLAGLAQVIIFAFAHYPFWGLNAVWTFLPFCALSTLVYLWRRDLFTLIIYHIAVDFVGLILAPPA